MPRETTPVDIEAFIKNSKPWDPYYVARVLADLLGRQYGCEVVATLTPKQPKAAGE